MNMSSKTKSNLRIIFSSIALIAFVVFSLCDNLMVREYTSYHTYGFRMGLLNDIFLLIPFVALLLFSILERNLQHINRRIYVIGIFFIYLVQSLFMLFSDSVGEFSIFTSSYVGRLSELVTAILIIRAIMLILLPIAHKNMLRLYSLGMICFLGFAMFAALSSNYLYLQYSVTEVVIAILIDIVFHIALFLFSDCLDSENESESWLGLMGTLMYPIFGSIFDEDEFEDCECGDDETHVDYAVEYKKILIEALNTGKQEFAVLNNFLEELSSDRFYNNVEELYSTEQFIDMFELLLIFSEKINNEKPHLISEKFFKLIRLLLDEKGEPTFKMDAVTVSKLLLDREKTSWMTATKQYVEYDCDEKKENT